MLVAAEPMTLHTFALLYTKYQLQYLNTYGILLILRHFKFLRQLQTRKTQENYCSEMYNNQRASTGTLEWSVQLYTHP